MKTPFTKLLINRGLIHVKFSHGTGGDGIKTSVKLNAFNPEASDLNRYSIHRQFDLYLGPPPETQHGHGTTWREVEEIARKCRSGEFESEGVPSGYQLMEVDTEDLKFNCDEDGRLAVKVLAGKLSDLPVQDEGPRVTKVRNKIGGQFTAARQELGRVVGYLSEDDQEDDLQNALSWIQRVGELGHDMRMDVEAKIALRAEEEV
jgi:hypothetical protein